MSYSYNLNYVNLRNLNDFEFYLYKNNLDVSFVNYNGEIVEMFFKTEKNINTLQSLLNNYPNELKEQNGDNFISLKNSTTSNLQAFFSFSGEYENVSEFNCISVFCNSNVPSLPDGFEIHYSLDGVNTAYNQKFSIAPNKNFIQNFPITTKYIKIVYKNGSISQSSFKLSLMYFKNNNQFINELSIKEEYPSGLPTSGKFRIQGFETTAISNTSTVKDFSWKYPISALKIKFMTTLENIGDTLNVFIIPAVNIGKLETSSSIGDTVLNISSSSMTGISVGYFVFITDGVNTQDLGLVLNKNNDTNQITVQFPLKTNFKDNSNLSWRVPVGITSSSMSQGQHNISVSETVLQRLSCGMNLKIFNGSSIHDFGEITQLDIQNNYIEIENTPSITFSANSLLFAKVNNVKNMKLNKDDAYEIGGSKIGGSYLNAYYVVRLVYTNSKNENVNFCWQTEYLY